MNIIEKLNEKLDGTNTYGTNINYYESKREILKFHFPYKDIIRKYLQNRNKDFVNNDENSYYDRLTGI